MLSWRNIACRTPIGSCISSARTESAFAPNRCQAAIGSVGSASWLNRDSIQPSSSVFLRVPPLLRHGACLCWVVSTQIDLCGCDRLRDIRWGQLPRKGSPQAARVIVGYFEHLALPLAHVHALPYPTELARIMPARLEHVSAT